MNTKVVHKQATLPPRELVDGVELERAALFNKRARRARVRDERPPEHDTIKTRGGQRAHVGERPAQPSSRERHDIGGDQALEPEALVPMQDARRAVPVRTYE